MTDDESMSDHLYGIRRRQAIITGQTSINDHLHDIVTNDASFLHADYMLTTCKIALDMIC